MAQIDSSDGYVGLNSNFNKGFYAMKTAVAQAIDTLRWNKGKLMEAVYGKNYRGIDSALPQDYVDAKGLSYGNEDIEKNLFYFVTNYNEKGIGAIENMLDKLSMVKIAAILLLTDGYINNFNNTDNEENYKLTYENKAMIIEYLEKVIFG